MRFNRLTSLALCLGVVLLLMVGSAFAGTTSFNSGNALKFAREVGALNAVYTMPTATPVVNRAMTIIRLSGTSSSGAQNFLIDVTLSGGAVWDSTNTWSAGAGEFAFTPSGYVVTPLPAPVNPWSGTSTVTFFAVPASSITVYPSFTLALAGKLIKDVQNQIGQGNTIQITVQTRDANTGSVIDTGTDTVDFIKGAYGATISNALVAGSAVIDVGANRTMFVGSSKIDGTPKVGISNSTVYNLAGNPFALTSADAIDFIITGDLTGVTSIQWGLTGSIVTKSVNATEKAAGAVTLTVLGDNLSLNGTYNNFAINVDGTTILPTRTLTIAINLRPAVTANNRNLVAAGTTFTVWTLNGSVLTANWVNGNNAALNSRIYLWNPGGTGDVSVAVYTLPNSTAGSTLLGTVAWGTLVANSGANIKLAEDILTPLGIALPYTTNGGNLVLIFTIRANGVFGISQTFSSAFAYGTYALR